MDPLACIRRLGAKIIYHVHAKDTRIDPANTAVNGLLDTRGYGEIADRSWVFRTVGYGHDEHWWCDFVSTLRMVGYDGVLSIEHEDGLMSAGEGFTKGVEFLRRVIIKTSPAPCGGRRVVLAPTRPALPGGMAQARLAPWAICMLRWRGLGKLDGS